MVLKQLCFVATGSRKKLSRVTSVGDLRFPTDHSPEDKWGVGRVSGSSDRGRGRSSADESRASSRGSSHKDSGGGSSSGGGGGPRIKLSMSGGSSEGHGKVYIALCYIHVCTHIQYAQTCIM